MKRKGLSFLNRPSQWSVRMGKVVYMTNQKSKDQLAYDSNSEQRRRETIGGFFRARRIVAGLSEIEVTTSLELETPGILVAYETGRTPIPLEDIFALTNLLNIAPEDVLALIHGVYSENQGPK